MSTIRALRRSDLPSVAALYELVVRSGSATAPPGLASYFERIALDQPWADPEIPSLVCTAPDGAILGFQGSHTRRARFDEKPIRIACAGQLVAHPDGRRQGVGARLISAYLHGPQDLTITDGATPEMRRIWTTLGGELSHLACLTWTRVLRPWAFLSAQLRGRGQQGQPLSRLQVATTWAVARRPPLNSPAQDEPLTPAVAVELLPRVTRGSRLRPAYDESFITWLLAEAAAVTTRGILTARVVRNHTGTRIGWFVYYLVPLGTAQVLQIAAAPGDVDAVFVHLLRHAHANGAVAVQGRLEANLLEAIGSRGAALSFTGEALLQSRDRAILGAIASGQALLTRLDGEWWMGHHLLSVSSL